MEENFIEKLINNLMQDRNLLGDSFNWANWMSKLLPNTCKFCVDQHGKIVDVFIHSVCCLIIFYGQIISNATSIMLVNEFCLCSAVVDSPVSIWSLTVQMTSAFLPARAAFMYSAGASISSASTLILDQLALRGSSLQNTSAEKTLPTWQVQPNFSHASTALRVSWKSAIGAKAPGRSNCAAQLLSVQLPRAITSSPTWIYSCLAPH